MSTDLSRLAHRGTRVDGRRFSTDSLGSLKSEDSAIHRQTIIHRESNNQSHRARASPRGATYNFDFLMRTRGKQVQSAMLAGAVRPLPRASRMAKRRTSDTGSITVLECVLLFCVDSGTDWQRAVYDQSVI
jgi:hypothetical protein